VVQPHVSLSLSRRFPWCSTVSGAPSRATRGPDALSRVARGPGASSRTTRGA
jgi:hypothetical protein